MRLTTWASCQSNIQLVCLNCGFAGAFPVTHYIGQFGLVSSLILVLTPQSRCSVWPLNITFAYILFSMVLVWLLHSLWVLANPDFLTSKMALSDQKPFWACLAYSFNVKFSQHLQDRKKLYQTCPLVRQIIVDTYLFKKSWHTSCCVDDWSTVASFYYVHNLARFSSSAKWFPESVSIGLGCLFWSKT